MRLRLSNGLAFAYRTRGVGRPIVLLHPVGTRGAFWEPVMDLLADRYRPIAVDFRGHGESDVPARGFTLDDLADDVIELLRMQRAAGAVVIGCSLGGMVTQGVALKAPELLSAIVIADTGHRQTDETRAAMTQRAQAALKGMPTVLDTTIERWFPAAFRAGDPAAVDRVKDWLLADDPVVFSWCWEAIRGLTYGERLRTIQLPALVVRGAEDASSRRETMQELAGLLPKGRYVEMPEAGHVAPYQQPAQFAALVRDFLQTHGID
jgi:3-oxoadipate enol-lactonase